MDEPPLFPDAIWVWNLFQNLNTRRTYGFSGPLPITFESIDALCRMKGIYKDDDIDFVLRLIPAMDDIWLTDWYKQNEAREKLKPKSKGR